MDTSQVTKKVTSGVLHADIGLVGALTLKLGSTSIGFNGVDPPVC